MTDQAPVDVEKLFESGTAIDEAIAEAGRDARLKHKLLGVPLVVCRDGQVVLIPPEEIVVDPPAVNAPRRDSEP
jgi:hypothetical protein